MTDGKMDKQVKELTKDIYSMIRSDYMSRALASMLYGEGYRKASEVASDIIGEITRYVNSHQAFLTPIPMSEVIGFGEFLGELEKRYTEDTE